MKNPILILFLLISQLTTAQLFITIEPAFLRPGVMYNQKTNHIGYYAHAWFGNIKGQSDDGAKFYTNNAKLGAGISIPCDQHLTWYAGLNAQTFFNTTYNSRVAQLSKVKHFSCDLGVSLRRNRFTLLFITDPLNWETMAGISYRLKTKPCSAYNTPKKYK